MLRFFDYLFYALGPNFRVRFMPFIWLFLLIIIVLEPTGKVWYYVLPISAALIVFVIDYVFEKRATKARKYFSKTKYSKSQKLPSGLAIFSLAKEIGRAHV